MRKVYSVFIVCALFSAYQVSAQTPYASYPLDGNANDVSGNNYHGTIAGSPAATTNRNTQASKALLFNGSSDNIETPIPFDFPNRTVIAWMNASQIGGGDGINVAYACDYSAIQNGATVFATVDDNTLGNIIRLVCDQHYYSATANTNQWYQMAITRTPSVAKFFINGALVFTGNNPNGAHSGNGVAKAVIGSSRNSNEYFIGKIDDLLIYNTALPDASITANCTSLKDIYEIDKHLSVYTQDGNVICKLSGDFNAVVKATRLVDINGRILSERRGAFSGIINETDLPAGTYFVSVEIENTTRTVNRKVVVVR